METRTTLTLWSLRPAGEHAALRRVAQGAGFRVRTLSLQRLVRRDDAGRLAAALAASIRVYTSPAAVRFAAAQAPLARPSGGVDLAVGRGTAAALRRVGVPEVASPDRMDSDGLLALPALQAVAGRTIGVITAPGGRGLIAPALRDRGAEVRVAEVYARVPAHGGARRRAAFIGDAAAVLVASSAEAFERLEAVLPPPTSARGRALRGRPVVVGSDRLGARVVQAGFHRVLVADGPTPAALVATASRLLDLE